MGTRRESQKVWQKGSLNSIFFQNMCFYSTKTFHTKLGEFVLGTPQPSKMDLAALLNSRPAKGKRLAAKTVRRVKGKAKKRCQGSKKRPAKAMPAHQSSDPGDDVQCCLLLGCQQGVYLHDKCWIWFQNVFQKFWPQGISRHQLQLCSGPLCHRILCRRQRSKCRYQVAFWSWIPVSTTNSTKSIFGFHFNEIT